MQSQRNTVKIPGANIPDLLRKQSQHNAVKIPERNIPKILRK